METQYKTMSTMNISLPDSLKAFVDEQVTQRGYGTSSEYVRALLLEGAASAPAAPADAVYFDVLRKPIQRRARR